MKFDKRNPFAAWGHEEEKYTKSETVAEGMIKMADGQEGFQNETVKDDAYNETATVPEYTKTNVEAFFTNNECMQPVELATKAYGAKKELQREYPSNEELNYYGIQADDLKLYGEKENTVKSEEEMTETVNKVIEEIEQKEEAGEENPTSEINVEGNMTFSGSEEEPENIEL